MSTATLVCPQCGTPAAPGSRFCEEDGTRLAAPAQPTETTARVGPGGCRCGSPNDPDGTGFCETCGVRIRAPQIQGPAALGPDLGIATDVGKRHWRNEDAGAIGQVLVAGRPAFVLVICDGVSSASSSERAAAIAADAARASLIEALSDGRGTNLEASIAEAIWVAHRAVCDRDLEAEPDKDPPGATIVAAVARPGEITVGWLGDSRAYWLSEGDARQLSRDDSWLVEQVESGAMSVEEASAAPDASAITHCIGPLEGVGGPDGDDSCPPISPHTRQIRPASGGLLLLCSDGLWRYASEPAQLVALVDTADSDADAEALAASLVRYAVDCGGVDNVIVAITRLP